MVLNQDRLRVPLLLILLGSITRITYWNTYPPIYKLHAVFTPIDGSPLAYASNFQSYIAVRMPFYDIISSVFYLPFAELLGVKALSAFAVIITIISLPIFYLVVKSLFNDGIATYALILYALYPKFAVLSGQGFPEAASVAFVIFSVYAFIRGLPEQDVLWLGCAGVFALLAYLMFIPAVAVGLILTVWLYIDQTELPPKGWQQLVPSRSFVAYTISPGIIGVLYLIYGPFRQATGTVSGSWSNMASSIFVNNYDFTERIVRYVGYIYFDFWWHFRGYDKEDGILRIIGSLQDFFGELFILYAVGWLGITAMCSIAICYGLYSLAVDRSRVSIVVLSWVLVFAVFYTSRNWGWTGVFQTRHVFPIFPALCIAFGQGTDMITERLSKIKNIQQKSPVSIRTIVVVFFTLCFVVLLINGAVEGSIVAENHQLSKSQPVSELETITEPNETVAVATRWDYYDVVIYSESTIRPTLLAPTTRRAELFRNWTVLADVQQVEPVDLSNMHADYFYAAHCGEWRPYQQQYIDALNMANAQVVSQSTVERGAGRCTVRTVIIELPDR